MKWTGEMVERLRTLWPDHSGSEIGRKMHISKNAAVGKAHRLFLPPKPSPLPPDSPTRPNYERKPTQPKRTVGPTLPSLAPPAPVVVVPVLPAPPPVVAPVPRYLQRIRECCWPIGEPGTPSFRFCEEPAVAGKPYCEEHKLLAYVRVRDSARGCRSVSEHTFQAWTDRFLDRVVLPPMFTSGIDVASRDMTSIGRITKLQGRGVKFGLPDVFLSQIDGRLRHACWVELKRGTKVTARQDGVHNAMRLAGQYVYVCSSMTDILRALRDCGFALHPNADALAVEYEMRVVAKETAPRTPRKPASRKSRATAGQIKRAHAAGTWTP